MSTDNLRPTKKQREILDFITEFIEAHGYSPSYREIMTGLQYTSVATVAVHINNLIKRGHLEKRENSARSLEPRKVSDVSPLSSNVTVGQEKWLVELIAAKISDAEASPKREQKDIDNLLVLLGALHVLGFDDAMRSFLPRVKALT